MGRRELDSADGPDVHGYGLVLAAAPAPRQAISRRHALFGLALLPALLSGCASRFPRTESPLTAGLPAASPAMLLYADRVTTGDVIDVSYFVVPRVEAQAYRVGIGDVLRVSVTDHVELDRDEMVVLPDGTVSLPLIGSFSAVDQTLPDLARLFEAAYVKARLRDPRAVVSLVRGQQRLRQFMQYVGADRGNNRIALTVFDLQPLELPMIAPVQVDRPLAALRDEIRLAYAKEFNGQLAVTVNIVKRAEPTVYVMGEVKKPGAMALIRPVNLVSAVAMAGGFTELADEAAVLVLRVRPDSDYDYWTLDLKQGLLSPDRQGSFLLRSNDVVYVSRSPIADVNLFVRQYIRGLLPFDFGVGYALPLR